MKWRAASGTSKRTIKSPISKGPTRNIKPSTRKGWWTTRDILFALVRNRCSAFVTTGREAQQLTQRSATICVHHYHCRYLAFHDPWGEQFLGEDGTASLIPAL